MALHKRQRTTACSPLSAKALVVRYHRLLAMLFLTVGMALWVWLKVTDPATFPIKNIKIRGSYPHVSQQSIKHAVLPHIQEGFLNVDITAVRNNLLQLPWVARVSVRKAWPDTLIATITEKRAYARWNSKGVLTAEGDEFYPHSSTLPQHLPRLVGPSGQASTVLSAQSQLNKMLRPLHLHIINLSMTPRHALRMQLSNGMWVNLGRQHLQARVKRFIGLYQKVFGKSGNAVNYVDLRYPNGLAVSWKRDA